MYMACVSTFSPSFSLLTVALMLLSLPPLSADFFFFFFLCSNKVMLKMLDTTRTIANIVRNLNESTTHIHKYIVRIENCIEKKLRY